MSKGEEKLEGESRDVLGEHAEFFRQTFPNVLSEGKVDCEKLKQVLGEEAVAEGEHYNFTWAGKSDVFDAISRQTTKTLRPDKEASKNFDDTNHIFIEGENLETLKVLQKSYYSEVKMIYIDPPYNTGKGFVYDDNRKRTLKEEQEAEGNLDEEENLRSDGLRRNTKTGKYHSNWLNMMYPRLFLARNLLKDDGVIFVSIDDNEVHNLRMMMNEIFGEENFVAQIIWEKKYSPQNDATYFSDMHDYILCFAKVKKQSSNAEKGWDRGLLPRTEEQNKRYTNPDDDPRGRWKSSDMLVKTYSADYDYEITTPEGREVSPPDGRCWRFSKEKYEEMVEDNRIWFGKNGDAIPSIKRFLSEVQQGVVPSTMWGRDEVGDNQEAANELKDLFDGVLYDTPKPTRLIQRILEISTDDEDPEDIVMDFFTGSGTTAHAVMAQNAKDGGNRQCISVQLPEETPEDSEARKAGYKNIAEIARERIRRAGHDLRGNEDFKDEENDIGFKAYKLESSNFNHWRAEEIENEEVLQQRLEDAIETKSKDAEELAMVYEIMLKLGIQLTAEIEEKDGFYKVTDTSICLSEDIDDNLVESVVSAEPQVAVFLEAGFGSDEQKTNTALQLKDADIEFKVI